MLAMFICNKTWKKGYTAICQQSFAQLNYSCHSAAFSTGHLISHGPFTIGRLLEPIVIFLYDAPFSHNT